MYDEKNLKELKSMVISKLIRNENNLEIVKKDNTLYVSKIVRTNDDVYDKRNSLEGFSDRKQTPLYFYPSLHNFDVCHLIPYKYIGTENNSYLLIGASEEINQAMRMPESKLDSLINIGFDVLYEVGIHIDDDKVLNMSIKVTPFSGDSVEYTHRYSFKSDKGLYLHDARGMSKDDIQKRMKQTESQLNSSKNVMFDKQWEMFKESIVIEDGREIEGVQVTHNIFIDKHMNRYHHEQGTTILDVISQNSETTQSKDWIYSQYILYILGLNQSIVAYVKDNHEEMTLHIIEDKHKASLKLYELLTINKDLFDISDVIQKNEFTYTLYKQSHSILFERSWELEPKEIPYLDETSMTVYPAIKEDKSKLPVSFKNETATFVTGTMGSGKSASMRTLLMPFIQSDLTDVGIIDMKESSDWSLFEDYVQLLINNDSYNKGVLYLNILLKEVNRRNKIMQEEKLDNFWNLDVKDRPFNFKLIVIDEFHKLVGGGYNSYHLYMYDPQKVFDNIIREARSVGIHIICITQSGSTNSIDPRTRRLINNRFMFRGGGALYDSMDDKVPVKKHQSIPNNDKTIGVAISSFDNDFIKFGYYSYKDLVETLDTMPYRPTDLTISSDMNVVDDMYVPTHRREELDDWLQGFNVKPHDSDEYNGREYLDFLTHQLKFNNETQKQKEMYDVSSVVNDWLDSSQTSKRGVKVDEQKKSIAKVNNTQEKRIDELKNHIQIEVAKLNILRRKREAKGIKEESSREESIKKKIENHQDKIELLEK